MEHIRIMYTDKNETGTNTHKKR